MLTLPSTLADHIAQIILRQGWRLDPLLLFCQLLTAGTALGFALEALRLRQRTQAKPVRASYGLCNAGAAMQGCKFWLASEAAGVDRQVSEEV